MNRELKGKVNHMLMSHGLGRLEDGAGLMSQMGFLVRDEAHFQQLIAACEPEERRNMYEALRPHLRFAPQSLEHYLIEARRDAEARQLPVVGEDGQLHAYTPPEVNTVIADTEAAQVAVNEAFARKRLHVVCGKCTREAVFTGDWENDCLVNLRRAGWRYDIGARVDICADCFSSAPVSLI
ncbi:MAG: hypothetical protein ACRD9L_27950 [Bryobacteraceae bacterium]